jgi:hypothetical protein
VQQGPTAAEDDDVVQWNFQGKGSMALVLSLGFFVPRVDVKFYLQLVRSMTSTLKRGLCIRENVRSRQGFIRRTMCYGQNPNLIQEIHWQVVQNAEEKDRSHKEKRRIAG